MNVRSGDPELGLNLLAQGSRQYGSIKLGIAAIRGPSAIRIPRRGYRSIAPGWRSLRLPGVRHRLRQKSEAAPAAPRAAGRERCRSLSKR